jgi:hypothetical protein
LMVVPESFVTISHLPSMLRLLAATRTVQAASVRHDNAAQPDKVFVRNA